MSVADLLDRVCDGDPRQLLLIGLGNSLRSDDGIGPHLVKSLRRLPGLMAENVETRPERSFALVASFRPRKVIFFDAADFSAPPGTLKLIDGKELADSSLTSHRLPLAPVLEWIETEHQTPCRCLGVQFGSMQLGEELTPQVAQTAQSIIAWFERKIGCPVDIDPNRPDRCS